MFVFLVCKFNSWPSLSELQLKNSSVIVRIFILKFASLGKFGTNKFIFKKYLSYSQRMNTNSVYHQQTINQFSTKKRFTNRTIYKNSGLKFSKIMIKGVMKWQLCLD